MTMISMVAGVIRNKSLTIPNIPKDNMIGVPLQRLVDNDYKLNLHHGGLWLLLKPEILTSGDHLVWFKAQLNQLRD